MKTKTDFFDAPSFLHVVKWLGCTVVAVLVAWSASSCGDGGTEAPPNQAPVTAGTVPAQTITEGESQSVDVRSYFSDPDGDALTYSGSSSATGVATVSVSGSTVAITAVSPGEATMTVTATDPGGMSAAQSFAVTVEQQGGFRDDFVILDLSLWDKGQETTAEAENGLLNLSSFTSGSAIVARPIEPALGGRWTATTRMRRDYTADVPLMALLTGHSRYTSLYLFVDGSDYTFTVFDDVNEEHITLASGTASSINEELGQFNEVAFELVDGEYRGHANDEEIFRVTDYRELDIIAVALAVASKMSLLPEATFDWVEITGSVTGSVASMEVRQRTFPEDLSRLLRSAFVESEGGTDNENRSSMCSTVRRKKAEEHKRNGNSPAWNFLSARDIIVLPSFLQLCNEYQ